MAKIVKTHFVGNGFAEVSEKQMMQDILRNGPISVEFLANEEFANYKSGIISEKGIQEIEDVQLESEDSTPEESPVLSSMTMTQKGYSFVSQTHTVLIVGWGSHRNSKYWIVRNSYGPSWGMNGHFLMRRGNNDFGFESNLISYEPGLCSEKIKDKCHVI